MTDNAPSFPNESADYRNARNALLDAEAELRAKVEEVAAMRRALPPGGAAQDYVFDGVGGPVRLSELFEDGLDTLILYHFMFSDAMADPCPMCTAFMDGADGHAPNIGRRASFAVVARSPIERFAALADSRGWRNTRLLSSHGNTYARDYLCESPDGNQLPMCNVFTRGPDGIRHFWGSELLFAPSPWHPRHVDQIFSMWHFLDLTPEGRGDFFPSL